MSPPDETRDSALWDRYVSAASALDRASLALAGPAVDRAALIRAALTGGRAATEKAAVARLLPALSVDELRRVFDLLVRWASTGHSFVHAFRAAVAAMPRCWVLERIESVAEPLLSAGDDDEYQRLLELYSDLDPGLTRRLALRAAAHPDENIRDAGEDWLERLAECLRGAEDAASQSEGRPAQEHVKL